jgi:dimethylamine--corrinoid protein Co-methyltransferase
MASHRIRMGDGRVESISSDRLKEDILAGTEDAADRGRIPPLTEQERDHLFDLFAFTGRVVGVEPGREVVLSDDGVAGSLWTEQGDSGVGVPVSREQAIRLFERAFGFDTSELGHPDYSFKPVKPVVANEQQTMESVLLGTMIPIYYGAMPNLATYARPDGPFGNPSDLLPQGKIDEAREAQVEAADACFHDLVYVGRKMAETGADGLNFDTTASAGDAEFMATLRAVEELSSTTHLSIQVGMAAEFVLGMHGKVEYDGTRLAGLYPHEQVTVVEKAGAAVFGPVVNTNTRMSTPWNVARAVTFVKACSAAAGIPIHANVGMGVGGVPMCETPPVDAVTRASAAMVEIGRVDGL